jgi:hypothetical protein
MASFNINCVSAFRLEFVKNIFCRYLVLFVSFYFFACSGIVYAQEKHSTRNAVYIELASRGPVYSVNYDRIFREGDKLAYSFRAGFSIEKNAVSFPLGIHLITGIKDHHAEFSLNFIPYIDYDTPPAGSNKDHADKYLYINPGIGYRYQKKNTGIFLRAAIGPSIFLDPPSDDFWNMDPKLYGFGSVGIGIGF